MSEYTATIRWARQGDEAFTDNKYSRGHTWRFDGGLEVPGSASPHVVPLPWAVEASVDPEEAFVAALSSCHMLVFLSIAAKRRYVVESYVDEAVGVMGENAHGKTAVTRVTLQPSIIFSGERRPSRAQLEMMHHTAHENCFIANSVTTEVVTKIMD